MSKIMVRRIKKKISNNKVRLLFIIFFLLISCIGTSYSLLNTVGEISGGATIVTDGKKCDKNIELDYVIAGEWSHNGEYFKSYKITITNNSDDPLSGWEIVAKGPSDLDVSFGSVTTTINNDNSLLLKDVGWNSIINAHSKIEVEICFYSIESNFSLSLFSFEGCDIFDDNDDDVVSPGDVQLTGIEIIPSEFTISVGEIVTLRVVKNPVNATGAISFSSSNNQIVTVDEFGQVTGVSEGSATIKAISDSGLVALSNVKVELESKPPVVPNFFDLNMTVEYTNRYSYENTFQFDLYLTNNMEREIRNFKILLDLPLGTEFSFWTNPGFTQNGNELDVSIYDYNTFKNGEAIYVSGIVTLPPGYYGADYTKMPIINIVS